MKDLKKGIKQIHAKWQNLIRVHFYLYDYFLFFPLLHLVLKGFFSIPLTFSWIFAPAPRLVVYVIFPNGKIIADSAVFSVSMCFRNKVGFVSMAKCVRVNVSAAKKRLRDT